MTAVLKCQQNLVWSPEGHRSPTGKVQPSKPGIGMLLNHFPVPVVPVFIRGTHKAMLWEGLGATKEGQSHLRQAVGPTQVGAAG